MFDKYQHVERIFEDNIELQGLLDGEVSVFPKLDGSNHCIWFDDDKQKVMCASRNNIISEGYDPTKFLPCIARNPQLVDFVKAHPNLRLFGEYMTPHTLRTYREDVWGNFYVFDVISYESQRNEDKEYISKTYMPYDYYSPIFDKCNINYIKRLGVYSNPTTDDLKAIAEVENWMIEDDKGAGEGIVVKRYDYKNVYGRTTWGKIVREEFKAKSRSPNKGRTLTYEDKLIEKYLTQEFISKEYHKFMEEQSEGWTDKYIPLFLKSSYQEFIKDNIITILEEEKNPTINTGSLRKAYSPSAVRYLKRAM